MIKNKNNIKQKLIILTLLFSFMPFFSFIPIHTDVQPLFLIPMFLLLFSFPVYKLEIHEIVFFFIALYSIVYINFDYPNFSMRKSLGLMIAFFIYHFFKNYHNYMTDRFLYYIVLINLIAVVFHYFSPGLFIDTLGMFVRIVKITSMEGARGASGFSTEPGFTGALAVFYIAVAYYLKDYKNQRKYFKKILILSFILILLTKSGTGYLYALVFMLIYKFNIKYLLLFVIGLFIFSLYNVDLGRGTYVIQMLFKDPEHLFLVDASVGTRIYSLVVGILSVFEYPLGSGSGSYSIVQMSLDNDDNLLNFIATDGFGNVFAFVKYSVEIGIVFWIMLFYLLIKSIHVRKFSFFVLGFIFTLAFPIIFPPIWFLFLIAIQKTEKVSKKLSVGVLADAQVRV